MRDGDNRHWALIILIAWTVLNLIQAAFTELFHDEAYYWVYAQNLSIGYFDHPPAIALMIRMGYELLGGELGLRLFVVAASTATVYFMYLLAGKEKPLLYFAIAFSIPLVHVGGFLAAPDIALLLSVPLFFLAYRKYLEVDNWRNIILLSLAIALMLWSKYHSLMVLFFVILSYPKLLIKRSFWLVVACSTLLYLPHLVWAFENGFSSLVYHLGDRSKKAYTFMNTWEYISGEYLAIGPLTAALLLPAALLRRTQDQFERSLKWVLIGILAFLFLMTFAGRVEANWAASAFVPLIILAYRFLREKQNWQKWLYYLALPSMFLFLILRIFLMWNFLPELQALRPEFHGWDTWAERISEEAGDRPVVFPNSYQLPSKYMFYSGKKAISLNSIYYRKNQYDLLGIEEEIQGEEVLFVTNSHWYLENSAFDSLNTGPNGIFYFTSIPNYRSYQKLQIEIIEENMQFKAGDSINLPIQITTPYPVDFGTNQDLPVHLVVMITQKGELISLSRNFPPDISQLRIQKQHETKIHINMPKNAGEYEIFISLAYGWMDPGRQGHFVKLVVE